MFWNDVFTQWDTFSKGVCVCVCVCERERHTEREFVVCRAFSLAPEALAKSAVRFGLLLATLHTQTCTHTDTHTVSLSLSLIPLPLSLSFSLSLSLPHFHWPILISALLILLTVRPPSLPFCPPGSRSQPVLMVWPCPRINPKLFRSENLPLHYTSTAPNSLSLSFFLSVFPTASLSHSVTHSTDTYTHKKRTHSVPSSA